MSSRYRNHFHVQSMFTDCSLSNFALWSVTIAAGAYFLRQWIKGGQFTERVSAKGKIAVVTGANAGLGKETVRGLNLAGAKVYMLCRSEERANEAKVDLVEMGCDASRLIFIHCDLTKFSSVRQCAKKMEEAEDHVDILINNAGIMFYPKFELTEDGHEMTWQSNHLGSFLLTELLLPLVKEAEEGRIVNVSSLAHKNSGPLELDTIDTKEQYGFMAPYARSKLANVMHARELTRRLQAEEGNKVTANSIHPGACITDLGRHLWINNITFIKPLVSFFFKTDRDGAQTSLFLALSEKVKGLSGGYYADCKRTREKKVATDDLACKQLFDYSLKTVGLT